MVCTDMWFVEFSKWCRNGRNSVALVDILIKFFESRVVGFSPALYTAPAPLTPLNISRGIFQ